MSESENNNVQLLDRVKNVEKSSYEQQKINGEINSQLNSIKNSLEDSNVTSKEMLTILRSVEKQAILTNGRVNRVETDIESLKNELNLKVNSTDYNNFKQDIKEETHQEKQKDLEHDGKISEIKENYIKHQASIKTLISIASGISILIGIIFQILYFVFSY